MTFSRGEGCLVLQNPKGETVKIKFEVQDAKTLQLNKMIRGENISGEITMASIEVPKEVQAVLPMFREQLTIVVKSKKIIFQSGSLYIVFGR